MEAVTFVPLALILLFVAAWGGACRFATREAGMGRRFRAFRPALYPPVKIAAAGK